jgi:hypothetical protein
LYSGKVPDFNTYSARQPLATLISHNVSEIRPKSHEDHVEQADFEKTALMPKPLFIKKRTSDLHISAGLPPPPLRTGPLPPPQRKTPLTPAQHSKFLTSADRAPQIQRPLSPLLTTHTTHLLTFRSLVSKHLTTITATIATTSTLQTHHKFLTQSKRIPSFWSFEPVTTTNTTKGGDDDGDGEGECCADEVREKRERIERLRGSGWRVTKERHGWKGGKYYEELREAAMEELTERG